MKNNKPITDIYFNDSIEMNDEQQALLACLLQRPLTDVEKTELDFDVYAEVGYPDPDVGVFNKDIDNVIVTYQDVDITELWDKPEFYFWDKVWNEIEKEYNNRGFDDEPVYLRNNGLY